MITVNESIKNTYMLYLYCPKFREKKDKKLCDKIGKKLYEKMLKHEEEE